MSFLHLLKITLTDSGLEGAPSTSNKTVPQDKNGTTERTSEVDNAVGKARGEPLAQDLTNHTMAVSLGLLPVSTAIVKFPLSEAVQRLLGTQTHELSEESSSLWSKLYRTIDASEVIWRNGTSGGVAVMKCSSDTVVKMIPNFEDFTEYTALQYLRRHAPNIPVPEPLGAVMSEQTAYIFMSFIPGPTLESVWAQLPNQQKISLSNQLSGILLELRQIQIPKDCTFGGVGGEGCKDTRRHTRISQTPIRSLAEFEDFIFSNPVFGGSVYIKLLRSMSQSHPSRIVFSHGDLRTANIIVLPDQQGNYTISGILDWEMGGFYPDYWEAVKATNTMAPQEEDDWYLHLPTCASPTTYPIHWLLDRKWDVHVA